MSEGGVMYGAPSAGTMIPLGIYTYMVGQQQVVTGFQQIMSVAYRLRSIITQASITTYVFMMLMRRQSQTARSLETAQENANEAIQRYGRFSLEARQALRRLEQAQENAKFAQIEFAMQTVFATFSIISMIPMIIDLIAKLKMLEMTLWGVSIAKVAAFGGIAVAGIVGGIAIGSIVFGGRGEEEEFDEQWREAGAYVARERRRMRG